MPARPTPRPTPPTPADRGRRRERQRRPAHRLVPGPGRRRRPAADQGAGRDAEPLGVTFNPSRSASAATMSATSCPWACRRSACARRTATTSTSTTPPRTPSTRSIPPSWTRPPPPGPRPSTPSPRARSTSGRPRRRREEVTQRIPAARIRRSRQADCAPVPPVSVYSHASKGPPDGPWRNPCPALLSPSFVATCSLAALAAGPSAARAQPPAPPQPPVETVADPACAALAAPGLFKDMTVTSAQGVQLGAGSDCEMTATLSPAPGSKIGVVYRLPKHWNGRLVGYGGGGWAGNVRLPDRGGRPRAAATPPCRPTAATRAPHAFDASWTAPGRQARRRGHDRLLLARRAPDDRGRQAGRRQVLRQAAGQGPVHRLLHRRAHGPDGGPALPGRLRRHHRRRPGLQPAGPDWPRSTATGCSPSRARPSTRRPDPGARRRPRRLRRPGRGQGRHRQRSARLQVRSGGAAVQARPGGRRRLPRRPPRSPPCAASTPSTRARTAVVAVYPYSPRQRAAWPQFQNTTPTQGRPREARDLGLRASCSAIPTSASPPSIRRATARRRPAPAPSPRYTRPTIPT